VSCGNIFIPGNVRSLPKRSGELDTTERGLSDVFGAFNDFALQIIKRAGQRAGMYDCHIPEKEREHASEKDDLL